MIAQWTATAVMSFGCLGRSTTGASSAAELIAKSTMDLREHLGESSLFKIAGSDLKSELAEIMAEPAETPVAPETVILANTFIDALPLHVPAPSISADADGDITLEWYSSPCQVLAVSISPAGKLNYASLLGSSKTWGSEEFTGSVSPRLLDLIMDAAPLNAAQAA